MNRSRVTSRENKLNEDASKPSFRNNVTAQHILGGMAAPSTSESTRKESFDSRDGDKSDSKYAALKRNYDGLSKLIVEQKSREKAFDQQISELNKENTHYKLRIQNLEKQSQQLKETLDKTLQERSTLVKSLDDMKSFDSEKKLMVANYEKLRKEHKEVTTNYESARKELDFVRRWKIEVENELKKYRQDLDEISKEFKKNLQYTQTLETVKLELEKKLAEDLQAREFLMSRIKKYEDRESEIKSKWDSITAQLNKERLDNTHLQNRYNAVVQELDRIAKENESRASLMKLSNNNENEMKERIKNMSDEIEGKNQEIERLKNSMKDVEDMMNNGLQSFNRKIENLMGSLESYRSQVSKYENILAEKDKRIADLESLASSQKQTILGQAVEISSLHDALNSTHKTSEEKYQEVLNLLDSYKQQIHTLKLDLSQEKQRSEKLINDISSLESFRSSSESLRNEIENLRRNFDRERAEMMKQIETSKSYSTQLKSDYDNLYKSYEDFQAQLNSHSDKSSKLISENMQLTKQLKEAQAEVFNLKSQYEALDSNYKRANDQLGSATGREEIIKSLRNTITILESRLETFQSELNRNRDYERLLNEKSLQCTSLESQLHLKSKEASDLFKTNKDQSVSILKQKEEIESLRSNFSKSQLACDSLKSSSADSLNTIKKLQSEIQDLKRSNTEELEKLISEKTKSVSQGIDKISTAIQSIENNLHCMHCFETLHNAVICVPCGHWYCERCTQGYNTECSQCSMLVEISVRSVLVDEMVNKISYSKETLGHIHRIFKT